MSQILYLYATIRTYEDYINIVEERLNEEDELLARLEHNETSYALHNRQTLDISMLSNEVYKSLFKFTFREHKIVSSALGFPENVSFRQHTRQRFSLDRHLSLAIMLRRLAYPSKLLDLELLFGIDKATISTVFNTMIEILNYNYEEGITFIAKHLHSFNLQRFAEATERKGSCFAGVIGFVDGTLNGVARPSEYQEILYNGHVTYHGLNGPFAGAMHDQAVIVSSGIMDDLRKCLDPRETGGELYAIYGDPTYVESDILIKPFRTGAQMHRLDNEVNYVMSKLGIIVEWGFGHVANFFAFLKYKPGQKMLLSRCALFYKIGTLMKNIHICVNGKQSSSYFGISPPTLEAYMDEIRAK
ncbi:hypothetical protein INT47_012937 [Mucor saturninus]|uniref:DDE Tnp4 domain-containing protein n=1 Tax=Mucor saturninus TaxID=64648 RepID=A0A8H7QX23_9FUNG|nr:hypothetical protein INT47_012937 [Mucor saturninus]